MYMYVMWSSSVIVCIILHLYGTSIDPLAKLTADHPMSSLISARMADKFLADLWTASLPLRGPQLSSSPLQGVDPPQSLGHPVDPSHVCQYSLCFCQLLKVHITISQTNNHEIIQIGDWLSTGITIHFSALLITFLLLDSWIPRHCWTQWPDDTYVVIFRSQNLSILYSLSPKT